MARKIKIVCTDKIPLPQGTIRQKPGFCFKQGLRVGFAAGAQKADKAALKKQVKMNTIGKDNIKLGAQKMAIKRNVAVLTRRRAYQAQKQAQNREAQQMAANDVNIEAPIVRNPTRPSIKEILDRINPQVNGKKQKNDLDFLVSNISFNVPEFSTAVKKKQMKKAGMIAYLIANKGYRA